MAETTEQITYREYKNKDRKYLCKEMCETFGMDCYSDNPLVLKILYNHYFLTYLRNYNYTQVAIYNNKPIGIVIGSILSKQKKDKYKFLRNYYKFLLKFTKAGRLYFKNSYLVKMTDKKLIKKIGHTYNEMKLLVVNKEYRHFGIGKTLIKCFENQVKKEQNKSYYLFTDDSCNVEYYKEHGYEFVNATHIGFSDDEDCGFYLCEKDVASNN